MTKQTEFRQPFKFCAELYRSADFFLLKPLLPVVQECLSDYCDDKIKWMYTKGNPLEDCEEQTARACVEDLKAAILEAHKWNTPIIHTMLKEFVWAGRHYLVCDAGASTQHLDISGWLDENVPKFKSQVVELFKEPTRRWTGAPDDA